MVLVPRTVLTHVHLLIKLVHSPCEAAWLLPCSGVPVPPALASPHTVWGEMCCGSCRPRGELSCLSPRVPSCSSTAGQPAVLGSGVRVLGSMCAGGEPQCWATAEGPGTVGHDTVAPVALRALRSSALASPAGVGPRCPRCGAGVRAPAALALTPG